MAPATVTNGRMFRSERSSISKYALAHGICNGGLALEIALRLAIGSHQ
jgi:hypothetical protein